RPSTTPACPKRTFCNTLYGHGSRPAVPGQEPARRHATVAGAIVRYYIGGSPSLVVTAVKIIHG
ncbi:hypothetical protein ACFXPB_18095, partial [Streptomyces sp. NPDC059129]